MILYEFEYYTSSSEITNTEWDKIRNYLIQDINSCSWKQGYTIISLVKLKECSCKNSHRDTYRHTIQVHGEYEEPSKET